MKLAQIIHKIHKLIEAKEIKNITKKEMEEIADHLDLATLVKSQ